MAMTPMEILSKHSIATKEFKGKDGVIRIKQYLQFTYPKGKRNYIAGNTVQEVIDKLNELFDKSDITFDELVECYLNDEKYLKHRSNRYKNDMRYSASKVMPYLGGCHLKRLAPSDYKRAFDHLYTNLSINTIRKIITKIKSILDYALIKGYLDGNPIRELIAFPKSLPYTRYYLSEQEIVEYISKAKRHPMGNLFILYLTAGIPLNILMAITWKDIDFKNNTVHIYKKMPNYHSYQIVKLNNRERYYSIQPPFVMDVLKNELDELTRLEGKKPPISSLVFAGRIKHKKGLAPHRFQEHIRNFIKTELKKKYHTPDVYYTSAVIAIKAGCDITSIADTLSMYRVIEMFKDPRRFDLFEEKENNGACLFFDNLFFSEGSVSTVKENIKENTLNN